MPRVRIALSFGSLVGTERRARAHSRQGPEEARSEEAIVRVDQGRRVLSGEGKDGSHPPDHRPATGPLLREDPRPRHERSNARGRGATLRASWPRQREASERLRPRPTSESEWLHAARGGAARRVRELRATRVSASWVCVNGGCRDRSVFPRVSQRASGSTGSLLTASFVVSTENNRRAWSRNGHEHLESLRL